MICKRIFFAVLLAGLLISACGSGSTATPTQTKTPLPTDTPVPTDTPTPEPTVTPVGGASGQILYSVSVQEQARLENGNFLTYRGSHLYQMDLASPPGEELITKERMAEEIGVDLYRTRFFPSPDGSKVLVSASTRVAFDEFDEIEHYIVSPDLSEAVPILNSGATYVVWTWSPDGSMLLGEALDEATRAKTIYIVNSDGSGLRELAELVGIQNPVWAADGESVYWILAGFPAETDLATGESEVLALANVGLEGSLVDMEFSPDGSQVAFITDEGEVYVAESDFSNRILTEMEAVHDSCQGRLFPSIRGWSEDGNYLIGRDVGCVSVMGIVSPIWSESLIRVSDGKVLEETGGPIELCGWSPDGHLVYLYDLDEPELRLVDDGGDTNFSIEYDGDCPSWVN